MVDSQVSRVGEEEVALSAAPDIRQIVRDKWDNITLIGFPGSGKSTIGHRLARELGMEFVDGDEVICQRTGKTLPEIMEERGPAGFIEMENQVLAGLDVHGCIIAPGGSVAYEDDALQHFARIGAVVYLEVEYHDISKRVSNPVARGVVLRNGIGMSLRELWDERKPLYEAAAQFTVNTHGQKKDETTQAVLQVLAQG